jgi:topoisomerase-4 subunit A
VLEAIEDAFQAFKKQLKRAVKREDVIKLTEKPVRRIYKLDIEELEDQIKALEADIKQVKYDLNNLVDYAVAYYENLLTKYGKVRAQNGNEIVQSIQAKQVAIATLRLYVIGKMDS